MLRKQINEAYPGRNKSSDGWLGDQAHRARQSEHNPDANGVVRALDITHDPAHGVYIRQLADTIVKSRDPRVLYIIRDGEIVWSTPRSGRKPWVWMPYHGSNPHTAHFHTSVVSDPRLYDRTALWSLPKAKIILPSSYINKNITATMFDDTRLAYYDVAPGHLNRFCVALPYPFPSPRPPIEVWRSGEPETMVDAEICDKGPWHINNPYWLTKSRPQAESGIITFGPNKGRKSNGAGIDVTPALDKHLRLNGKGKVDWRFK